MNWWNHTLFAQQTAMEAGDMLLDYFGKITKYKGKSAAHDFVTEADLTSEKFIIDKISTVFPDHSILSEESGFDLKGSDYCWVIDPLDGTTNFVHEVPVFAISIGLKYKNETVAAVVYNPGQGQSYTAALNEGARLNDHLIHPSNIKTLSESLLISGFPYLHDDKWELSFDLFKDFYSRSHGVRRFGAASLDFCYVASGLFEGFWEFNLKPWDVCAGNLILKEAGGYTSDWFGASMPDSGDRVLATNGKIQKEMENVLGNERYALFRSI
ncbi:MAG: inositol monophosphatase [Candidatus Marinimicrobia bacterium]|jgi:myo-inositol-1(or 4)-monophosphatase|nr:inositol monophosphatase [Candidatus Neomarinimicrobiota bacterium]MBT3634358.1 inositol monophosphatase [Candidatus Neomarinimicrobiota bacterium]MBT3681733.1 inositol monophosphatase [Candidatus Neomarinimicrobiota bacterium]MBT3759459.1 inositol monophosphatase [Candidatus Neomarinimicrobiota bacterium]MBT3895947.1 inositol monophosphatase [Candidatus Neomarinimicrobiota bacterium]